MGLPLKQVAKSMANLELNQNDGIVLRLWELIHVISSDAYKFPTHFGTWQRA